MEGMFILIQTKLTLGNLAFRFRFLLVIPLLTFLHTYTSLAFRLLTKLNKTDGSKKYFILDLGLTKYIQIWYFEILIFMKYL